MRKMDSAIAAKPIAALALLAFALVLALGIVGQAQAAQGDDSLAAGSAAVTTQNDGTDEETPKLTPATLWLMDSASYYVGNYAESFYEEGISIEGVKSSNTKVLKITKGSSEGNDFRHWLVPRAVGKSTVTVTYKKNGETKTVDAVFSVKKLPNAIKSVTLNGKKLSAPKKTLDFNPVYNFVGKKATVKVSLASGWKIESMSASIYSPGAMEEDDDFDIKNGKAFKFSSKKDVFVRITIAKKASGDAIDPITYYLTISHENAVVLNQSWPNWNQIYIGFPLTGSKNSWNLFYNSAPDAKIYKATSSNGSVLKVTCGSSPAKLKLVAKKPGTSKVTLYYKYKGKKYQTSAKYTVDKMPIAKLFFNGKTVKLSNQSSYDVKNYKKGSAKVKVVPAKGWKVSSIECTSEWSEDVTHPKNGASVKTPNDVTTYWDVTLEGPSGKEFNYSVRSSRF